MGLGKLCFSDQKAETAYMNFRDSSKIETFEITLLFWALLLTSFVYPYLVNRDVPVILAFVGALCFIILLFFIKREMINYTEHLTVIVTFLLLLSSLTYSVLKVEEDSKILQFLRGWTFAGAEIVLVNQFRRLRLKFLFVLVAFLVRCGFIALFEHEAFVEDIMMHNFVTDIFVMYIYYHCESQERVIFKGYYDYREEFVKFRDLIENHLPQSVIILDPHTSYPLFANKTFAKIFTKKFASRDINVKDKQNTKPINGLVIDTLDLLLTQNDSIRYSCKYEPDLSRLGNGITLRHLLLELTANGFFNMDAVTVTCSYQNPRGKRSLFEVVLKPLTWDREEAVAMILDDITFQEKLIALKQADKNKDFVIATVSHELKTPLNGIIGLLQIMETKAEQPEALRDVLLCKDNATLLLNLVNSILDLQMFSQGKLRLKLTKIDLYQFLKDTVRLFQFMASQKGLYLNLKIGSNVEKEIKTDEKRLRQIIINLVGNAIKFTFRGGIDVWIERDPSDAGEYLKISVSDTGIGIKEDQKKKLFKVYGKFEETHDMSRNGAGLGLTICNTLVNALLQTKGEEQIRIESKEGVGSKFWFKVPARIKNLDDSDINLIELSDQGSSIERKIYSNRLTSFDSESSLNEILEDYDEKIEPNNLRSQLRAHTLKEKKDLHRPQKSPNFKSFPITFEEIPLHISKKFEEISFCEPSKHSRSLGADENLLFQKITQRAIQHKGLVLVVDDNPFNLMVAQNFLGALGYHVETATSGEEALTKVRNRPLKFILMDIQMPVMDGYETTKQLKKMMERQEIDDVPIIALSANDQDEDVRKSLKSGMVDHLSKPLLKGKLEACLVKLGRNQG